MPRRSKDPAEVKKRRKNRHEAHTEATMRDFIGELEQRADIDREFAEHAAGSIIAALEARLVNTEARQLFAQLPQKMLAKISECRENLGVLPRKMSARQFVDHCAHELNLDRTETTRLVQEVFRLLSRRVTEGEIEDVVRQLPQDLRELWPTEVQVRIAHVEEQDRYRAQRGPSTEVVAEAEITIEEREGGLAEIVDAIMSLPMGAQLGILRTLAPKVLAHLDERAQAGFLRDLGEELERAEEGLPTYDVRPGYGLQS